MKNAAWMIWSGFFVAVGFVTRPNVFGWAMLLCAALLVWPLIWQRRAAVGKKTFDNVRVVISAVLTVFCGSVAYAKINAPDPIETAVGRLLLDPSSAQFRNVRTGSTGISCGEVNAKNVMGAYTGFTEFVVVNGVAVGSPEKPLGGSIAAQTEYFKGVSTFQRTLRKCYQ